jgi:hypothetical protein
MTSSIVQIRGSLLRAVAVPLFAAGLATAAAAQAPSSGATGAASSPSASWPVNTYLEESERASEAAALQRASQEPIGSPVNWTDGRTRASGTIVPLRVTGNTGSGECRDYNVTVNVPARTTSQWNTNMGTAGNIAVGSASSAMSPAFTRQFVAGACRTASGALVPSATPFGGH